MTKDAFLFESAAGEQLHGAWWLPEGTPRGVLHIVHGMAEYIERYDALGRTLSREGFAVVGHDLPGHGEKTAVKGYFGHEDGWRKLLLDVDTLRSQAQSRFSGVPYFLMGHSMGSFVVRCYLSSGMAGAEGKPPMAGAALSGTGMPPLGLIRVGRFLAELQCRLGGEKKPAWLLHAMSFGAYNRRYRQEGPLSWLATDPAQVAAYAASPLCGFPFTAGGYREVFRGLTMLHDETGYARIPAGLPIYLFAGDGDPVGDFGKAPPMVASLLNAHGIPSVTIHMYPGERHETLNGKARAQVTADLLTWMTDNL